MALEVQPLKNESIEWDAFVRSMPGGSPFHLLAWKRAVETSFGHRPHYLMAIGEHGIEGVLPLFEVRGLLGGRGLISVPYGVYGGICGRSEPARRLLLDHATGLARRVGAGYVELRHRAGQEMDLPTKSLYVNFSRPISGDDEENLAAIPRKQRRMTHQGLKRALREAFPYAINDFMYWELMSHVAHAGYRVFDFGRSREGTGPYNFKRHWGFEPQPLPYQYALLDGGSIPNVSPANPKMRLAVEAWKRAPYPLTR